MAKNELQKQGRIVMLPVDCIEPSPYQARTAFDEPEIAALAVSILQNGLLQPISVRRVGLRKYQLIAGERRLRACRLAKLEKVPAFGGTTMTRIRRTGAVGKLAAQPAGPL